MVPNMALKDVAGQITAGAAEAGVHDEGRWAALAALGGGGGLWFG